MARQDIANSAQISVHPWGLGSSRVEYREAWAEQKRVHAQVVAGTAPPTLLMLEHDPVFTAGSATQPQDRPVDGSPVVDVDRGGRITWHGPGQLVVYPIVRLRQPLDVVDFVRRLERAVMAACATIGLETGQVPGRSGVWVEDSRKVCAIGIRVSRGATMHGLALNCSNDLAWYDRIVPCGIRDASVTTLSRELGREVTIVEAAEALTDPLIGQLRGAL